VTKLELLTDLTLLERHWEQTPFLVRGLGELSEVFSLSIVDELLGNRTLPGGSLRLFSGGQAVPEERYTRQRERKGRQRERLVDADAVLRHVSGGATVVLEELETYCPGVWRLAAAVRELTGFSTYCAGFVTPSSTPGLRAHYDLASVLIRQVHGSKRWRVSAPLRRLPEREWSEHEAPVGEPVLDVVLAAGDCLYVPRGYFHSGEATGQGSIHLSVAIRPVTWWDLLSQLVSTEAGETLRESLPFGLRQGAEETVAASMKERVRRMLDGIEGDDGSATVTELAHSTQPVPMPVREYSLLAGALADALEGIQQAQEAQEPT
jgi:ribosomal protein L16 Arg81 hydroxylase